MPEPQLAQQGPASQAMPPVPLPVEPSRPRPAFGRASGWLYAIAGFTALNAVALVADWGFRMLVGSGIALWATVFLWQFGPAGIAFAALLTIVVCAAFAYFGFLARRGNRHALIAALVVYAVDGAVLLVLRDWLGTVFHLLGLQAIWSAYAVARSLAQAPAPVASEGSSSQSQPPQSPWPEPPKAAGLAGPAVVPARPEPEPSFAEPVLERQGEQEATVAHPATPLGKLLGWTLLIVGAIGLVVGVLFVAIGFTEIFNGDTSVAEQYLVFAIFLCPLALCGLMVRGGLRRVRAAKSPAGRA